MDINVPRPWAEVNKIVDTVTQQMCGLANFTDLRLLLVRNKIRSPYVQEHLTSIMDRCKRLHSQHVRLSSVNKATDLDISKGYDGVLEVSGHKGFRSVRGTHGVCEEDWYFEVQILQLTTEDADGAARLRWSTRRSNFEGSVWSLGFFQGF